MSQIPLEQRRPEPVSGCQSGCAGCGCTGAGQGDERTTGAPAGSQLEPRDELLRFAADANELARRIREGQGTDLNHLIGDAVRSRAA